MSDRYEKEFIEMHDFFRAWFRGEVEKTGSVFERMDNACAEGFVLITAAGKVLERDAVLKRFFDMHGTIPNYEFWIENARIRHQHGDITICTFNNEEADVRTGEDVVTTTAVFREEESAPNGVVFLLVQDTPVVS